MYSRHLFLICLLLSACRTTVESKDLAAVPKSASAQSDVVLQKIVGRLSENSNTTQIYECEILAKDLTDADHVKGLIEKLENTELVRAYLFVAINPSIEIYAFKGDKQILIYEGASARLYPTPNDKSGTVNIEADELIKIAHEKCPTPKEKY